VLSTPLDKEKVYYSDGAITVTSSRAVLGPKTYAMANITSVSLQANMPGAGCGLVLLLVGLFLMIFLLSAATAPIGLIGLLMLIGGVAAMKQKTWAVKIGSASGEANALVNKDRAYIEAIVAAVNQAVTRRRTQHQVARVSPSQPVRHSLESPRIDSAEGDLPTHVANLVLAGPAAPLSAQRVLRRSDYARYI
jgi:hypothetical protein